MKVIAKRRGEWPSGAWREPGDVFDYDGPTKRPKRDKDGNPAGTESYFPSWMEKYTEPKKKAEDEAPPREG